MNRDNLRAVDSPLAALHGTIFVFRAACGAGTGVGPETDKGDGLHLVDQVGEREEYWDRQGKRVHYSRHMGETTSCSVRLKQQPFPRPSEFKKKLP